MLNRSKHFKSIRETTIDILNEMFDKNFENLAAEPLHLEPVVYHKTLDEIARKFFILQAMHLLTNPNMDTENIFLDLAEQCTLRNLGCEAEFFLKEWLLKKNFNRHQLNYLKKVCCDSAMILAQVLNIAPSLFDKEVLCRSYEDNWNAMRDSYKNYCFDGEWYFGVTPAQEMATEYDFVNCLRSLYNTDSDIRKFIKENRIYPRLENYRFMFDWLFRDLPFDL